MRFWGSSKLDEIGWCWMHIQAWIWWQGILLQSQFSLFLCILKPEAYAQKLDRSKTPAQLHIMNWHPDAYIYIYICCHPQKDGKVNHHQIRRDTIFSIYLGMTIYTCTFGWITVTSHRGKSREGELSAYAAAAGILRYVSSHLVRGPTEVGSFTLVTLW